MKNIAASFIAAGLLLLTVNKSFADDAKIDDVRPIGDAGSKYGALYLGFSTTTNYMDRGETQTQDKPAFQPYIEYNTPFGIYVGAWGSNVDFGEGYDDNWELDLYTGFRSTFGKFSYDLSYWRFYYDASGYYGDAFVSALDYNVTDQLKMGIEAQFDFAEHDQIYSPRISFTPVESWTIGGKYEFAHDSKVTNWDIGVKKDFGNGLNLDLRYYDSNIGNPCVVLTLNAVIDVLTAFSK
ncbi:hypothetical protein G6M85_21780 [Agrobacterium tumefaciens]|uniref:TorF family putative porin n=1 Tax=Agrobacterium tumefaciens TaxID=358 RepID=UPI0015722DE8|nr:TorF family putative porin [Agrobacterium tumefaciens]NTE68232.1 hypothetical protein [Agrobacterium tumefaciens]